MRINELYIRLMVWLGASPPQGFEYLLKNTKSNITATTEPTYSRIYRPELSRLLLNSIPMALLGFVVAGPLALFIRGIILVFQDEAKGWYAGPIYFGILGLPVITMSLLVITVLIAFIARFFAYIRVSSSGLEYQMWPFNGVRCGWSDVDRIGKQMITIDAILLKNSQQFGPLVSVSMVPKIFRFRMPKSIPLSGFKGWPQGQLAEDLYRYAPHLFDNASISQKPGQSNVSQY